MDEKGKYSTSALQLKQTNPPCGSNYRTFKTKFKFLCFLSKSPVCSKHMEAYIRGCKTFTFLSAERWDYKQIKERGSSSEKVVVSETWLPHCVTRFLMKQAVLLNTSYFRGQRLINCFLSSTADPLWDLSWLFGLLLTARLPPSSSSGKLGHELKPTSPPCHWQVTCLLQHYWNYLRSYWECCWMKQVTRHIKKVSVNGFWLLIEVCKNC